MKSIIQNQNEHIKKGGNDMKNYFCVFVGPDNYDTSEGPVYKLV